MTDETPRYEVLDEAEFDFSFENFREIGYEFTGTVTTSEVRAIPERTHQLKEPRLRKDGTTETEFTKPAHNQLVIWAKPVNGDPEKGDYKIIDVGYKTTLNKNSILGRFVEEAAKAGVKFKKPSELIGRTFQFERLENVKFGRMTADPFFVIRGEDKGAAGVTSKPATSTSLSDEVAAQLAQILNGVEASGAISAVTASPLKTDAKVVGAVASGAAVRELVSRGLIKADGPTLVLV